MRKDYLWIRRRMPPELGNELERVLQRTYDGWFVIWSILKTTNASFRGSSDPQESLGALCDWSQKAAVSVGFAQDSKCRACPLANALCFPCGSYKSAFQQLGKPDKTLINSTIKQTGIIVLTLRRLLANERARKGREEQSLHQDELRRVAEEELRQVQENQELLPTSQGSEERGHNDERQQEAPAEGREEG